MTYFLFCRFWRSKIQVEKIDSLSIQTNIYHYVLIDCAYRIEINKIIKSILLR